MQGHLQIYPKKKKSEHNILWYTLINIEVDVWKEYSDSNPLPNIAFQFSDIWIERKIKPTKLKTVQWNN